MKGKKETPPSPSPESSQPLYKKNVAPKTKITVHCLRKLAYANI